MTLGQFSDPAAAHLPSGREVRIGKVLCLLALCGVSYRKAAFYLTYFLSLTPPALLSREYHTCFECGATNIRKARGVTLE